MSAASAVADLLAMRNARVVIDETPALPPPIDRDLIASQRQPELRRAKRDSRGRRPTSSRICTDCGTTKTPSWRRGSDGARTLCNACGLRFLRKYRKNICGNGTLEPVHLVVQPHAHPIPPAKRRRSGLATQLIARS